MAEEKAISEVVADAVADAMKAEGEKRKAAEAPTAGCF